MKYPNAMFAAVIVAAAACVVAQAETLSYTDAAPYTDLGAGVRFGGAPSFWKGQLSRADVVAALRQARADKVIAVGDALDYPYAMKAPSAGGPASGAPSAQDNRALGAAANDGLTTDGYRFVGGEAGYVFVGRSNAIR